MRFNRRPRGGLRASSASLAADSSVDWRRNLVVLWFAQFTAIFGFSFALPFLPLYLSHELGVHNAHDLALWSGVSGSATGLGAALLSPVWGYLADHYGRKSMLIRAMIGSGLAVSALALTRSPLELVAMTAILGALSGTVAASTTIVATTTPREQVGRAMGVLSSAIALGSAVGPLVGGVAASHLTLRYVFIGGGVLLLVSVIPVIAGVREAPATRLRVGHETTMWSVIRAAGPGTMAALAVLLAAQALVQVSWSGALPLISLKLIELSSSHAAAATGIAFAVAGVASAFAGLGYSRIASATGYRLLAAAAAAFAAGAVLLIGVASTVTLVIAASFLSGLFIGSALPAITAMLGLEAPVEVQGRVFGISASMTSLGYGLGPLLGGTIASVLNVSAGFYAMALSAVVLATLILVAGREPTR
jgi:MFS family permease